MRRCWIRFRIGFWFWLHQPAAWLYDETHVRCVRAKREPIALTGTNVHGEPAAEGS